MDGRCHIRLARQVWAGKDSLDTRWWSLVLDENHKVFTIRNGSCGDTIARADVPRILGALTDLGLLTRETMIAVDGEAPVIPGRGIGV